MRIAIIGDGAMGSLYGSLLSQANDVTVLSIMDSWCENRNRNGLTVVEKGNEKTLHPLFSTRLPEGAFDLVLLFVKGQDNEKALTSWKTLIDNTSFLLTLQNGAGHADVLRKFLPEERILIGVTEENSSFLGDELHVNRGGRGKTSISPLVKGTDISAVVKAFNDSDLLCEESEDVQRSIWRKILTNSTISASTALLGCTIDFLGQDENAFSIVDALLKEAVEVAAADGYAFDYMTIRGELEAQCKRAHDAHTSIERDLALGRRTECENITGFVVRTAEKHGVAAPCQKMALAMIHSLEHKNSQKG